MKDLTIEEKAKAYDNLIERLKDFQFEYRFSAFSDTIERYFPELKEPEEEKIRKDLISFLDDIWHLGKNANFDKWDKSDCSNWIAWLEKQGESVEINPTEFDTRLQGTCQPPDEIIEESHQDNADHIIDIVTEQEKPSEWSEEDENEYNHILKILNLVAEEQENKGYNNLISSVNWLKSFKDRIQPNQSNKPQGKTALEAIKEEKVDNANKVEPKFKVGDWVTVGRYTFLICDICSDLYDVMFASGEHRVYDTNILDEDKEAHLWTIADAKEGDVLISWTNKPFIYNGFFNEGVVGAYCGLNTFNRIIIPDKQDYLYYNWTIKKHVRPATKVQRDILFQKMEEAGYEWDSAKKEIIKINLN